MAKKRHRNGKRGGSGKAAPEGARKPTLSVCMIARDEAAFLASCLESVGELADEIVVGDTGSADDTPQVARRHGARVLTVPWEDDFSLARNAVLEEASGDWILVVDCDEVIAGRDHEAIRMAMTSGGHHGYRMTTRNYARESSRVGWQACRGNHEEERDFQGWFPTTKVRLFRNDPRIRFEGAVHELVEGSIAAIGGTVGDCAAPVHHYGYVDKDRPAAQYAAGAAKKAEADPKSPDAYYELALAQRDAGSLEEARVAIERSVELLAAHPDRQGPYLRRDFVFLVQGDILGRMGRADDAESAYLKALEADPACYQALNNLGTLRQRQGDFGAALDYYTRAGSLAPEVETIQENIRRTEKARETRQAEGDPALASAASETTARQTLSLCMIVRNEEARLGTCLESVADLADEIIVVDTGSTDATVAVAERYGAKMGAFPWCDDFSAARNVSLEMATGDWILWLDADDILPREYHEKIRSLLRPEKDRAYFLVLDSQGYEPVTCLQARLFPNLPGARFEYPVHEQISPSLIRLGVGFEATDVRVVHTGYTTPEVVREKQERYLRILERWLEAHPEAYIVRSHVATTYYIWGDLDRSIKEYERILNESDCRKDRNLVIETTSLLHLGRSWMRKDDHEKALPYLLEAQKLDDQYAVTNLTLGECYTRMGRSKAALEALERARASEDQVTFASNDPRAMKYSIRFFSGQNLEALGKWNEAAEQYRQAAAQDPSKTGALGALSTIYRKLDRKDEAIEALEEALRRDPDDPKHRFNRGTYYLDAGDEAEAERWFRRALEVDPDMPEPYLNLGFIARRRRDFESAEALYRKAAERDPDSYEPLANLGHLLLDQERYEEAGDLFSRVDRMRTGLLDVEMGLCAAACAQQRTDEVRRLLGGILRAVYGETLTMAVPEAAGPVELAQLLAECARMLLERRIVPCARLGFLSAYLLTPDSVTVALQLGEVYRATGEAWKAVAVYEAMIQRNPSEPELFRKLGACYETLEAPEAAQMCSERAAALEG